MITKAGQLNDKEQDKTLKQQESCLIFLHVCQGIIRPNKKVNVKRDKATQGIRVSFCHKQVDSMLQFTKPNSLLVKLI